MPNPQKPQILTHLNRLGNIMTEAFHYLALFGIGAVIVWSAAYEFIGLFDKQAASISDILLLFIYLELGAMIGIYFKTKRLPVRFLIYIAITALTRELVGIVQENHVLMSSDLSNSISYDTFLYLSGTILILAIASLILRFGSSKFPSSSLNDKEVG